jgi:hypothetical protein
LLAVGCLVVAQAMAQARGLSDVDTQRRALEAKDSQLMWWLHEVTDRVILLILGPQHEAVCPQNSIRRVASKLGVEHPNQRDGHTA